MLKMPEREIVWARASKQKYLEHVCQMAERQRTQSYLMTYPTRISPKRVRFFFGLSCKHLLKAKLEETQKRAQNQYLKCRQLFLEAFRAPKEIQ